MFFSIRAFVMFASLSLLSHQALSKKLMVFIIGWFALFGLVHDSRAANPSDFWIYVINDRDSDLRELLRKGANPNQKSPNQQTPLTMAAREGSWRVFDVLMASPKIDLNLANSYAETPLMYTALLGDLERSRQLIAKGARVNQPGWTPLHYAAVKGQSAVIKLLVSNGAKVNEPSPDGDTPLILAVRTGDIDSVQALINAGADPMMSNFKAQNAIEVARSGGNNALANALEKVVAGRQAKR
jgi:uncharacterized protein